MQGLPNIVSPFLNEFNESNNTGARMLYSIYHMTLLKITLKSHFWQKIVKIVSIHVCIHATLL